ncbi:MAG: pilus assembly protein TadG-related protein [Acidimicrobiia bacterium]
MNWLRARVEREDGAILVLAAVLLIVLFALAALAVDITLKSTDRQHLWNSADAAALAGASQLPDGLAAEAQANDFALANDADMAGHVNTTFRCLVGDRNNDGQPDAGEVPGVCDPGPDVPASGPPWVCADGICTAPCVPADGDTCNTIVLESDKTTDFAFAPAIGIDQGTTDIVSAACQGSCGAGFTGPVDLAIILDRTGSMNDSNNSLQKAKQAALAVLNYFDPSQQHVALGVLGAGDIGVCNNSNPTNVGSRWLGVGLSSDYKDNPTLDVTGDGTPDIDGNSTLVQKINCLNYSSQGTNLGSPISDD